MLLPRASPQASYTRQQCELDYLIIFNRSITRAMACTMQDLSDGVFINVANLTLARRDSYLEYLKAGIKHDILKSLRTAPIHMSALFLAHIISKAEEDICRHEEKGTFGPRNLKVSTPIVKATRQQQDSDQKPGPPAWKQIRRPGQRSNRGKASCYTQPPAKG